MNKIVLGFLALTIVRAGLVYAHGVSRYDFGMHEDVEQIVESGSFSDLEELRDECGMPIMHWVDSDEDFERLKESDYRGCHGRR